MRHTHSRLSWVAAAIDVADGMVRDVRIAFGGVAHVPWRAREAEAVLRGAAATEETFRRAADAELADAQPLRGNAFKVPCARCLISQERRTDDEPRNTSHWRTA